MAYRIHISHLFFYFLKKDECKNSLNTTQQTLAKEFCAMGIRL